MARTLLLGANWDLTLDASGNIALADPDEGLAQDAASAIMTWGPSSGNSNTGECYWDTTVGPPLLGNIFGNPAVSLAYIKQAFQNAALSVPGVASAVVFITAFNNRALSGQVQVVSASSGSVSAANFTVSQPQGAD